VACHKQSAGTVVVVVVVVVVVLAIFGGIPAAAAASAALALACRMVDWTTTLPDTRSTPKLLTFLLSTS
jgi:hypothetical protein